MINFLMLLFQDVEKSGLFQAGYEVGYFVGSNIWLVLTAVILFFAGFIYLLFFRKNRS